MAYPYFQLIRNLSLVVIACIHVLAYGQPLSVQEDPNFKWPSANSHFIPYDLPGIEPLQEVETFLHNTLSVELQRKDVTRSLTGTHIRYEQLFMGYPVAYSEVKVNLDKHHDIQSWFTSLVPTAKWPTGQVQEMETISIAAITTQVLAQYPGDIHFNRKVWFYHWPTETVYAAIQLHIDGLDGIFYDIIYHPSDGFLQVRDARHFYRTQQDTLVTMQVFMPDPLTSAQRNYGGTYRDNNDAEITVLNQERITRQARVQFNNGNFSLNGYNIAMKDIRPPSVAPPVIQTPNFSFTRGQDGFEYVNAYYHLSQFHLYLIDLGFSGITSFVLDVDAHGTTDDNSFFTNSNPPRIIFGDGGVDDAEDADVIVHEYGHAISFSVSPNTNNGFERKALDEGFGDYLAASYSRALTSFRWGEVYTWDGHNEYWQGRTAANNKIYPDDLGSNFYAGGEIWSAALMEAWPILGKENMDRLAVQVMYSAAANISLRDAAQLLLQAESQLYNGVYQEDLYTILTNRGLIESFETSISGSSEFIRGVGRPTIYLATDVDAATVAVYNLQGQLLASQRLTKVIQTLPAKWFPVAGMYLIQLRFDNDEMVQKTVFVSP